MAPPLPLAYWLFLWTVKITILAAQAHLFVWLWRVLGSRYRRAGRGLAAAALVVAAALAGSSELFQHERSLVGWTELPALLRFCATVWVAGCAGAYLLLATYWGQRRIRGRMKRAGRLAQQSTALRADADLGRRQVVAAMARGALAAPFALAGYGTFICRTQFDVREVDIGIRGLPPSLDGVRLAQLTDIHFGPNLSARELETVVAMANQARPHLTVVTGDLITEAGDPLEKCLDILSRLRADAGVWACMGNHERYAAAEAYCESYARSAGIRFLRGQSQLLRFGEAKLNLCGVDYQRQQRPYLRGAKQLLRDDALNLLLSHNPDVFPVAAGLGYDLVVSGHTHGGQVTVEIVEQWANPGRFFTPYVAGEYRLEQSALYVSRGIGTVNLAMRLGALPEVSLLTLRRA